MVNVILSLINKNTDTITTRLKKDLLKRQVTVEAHISGHPQEAEKVSATGAAWPLTGMCKYRVCLS